MSESVLRIVIDSRNAERNARNLSRELNSIERTGNHASSSMDSMSVATRNLAGYMMGLVTVGMAGTNEQDKNMLKVYQAFRNAGVEDIKARVLTAQVGREGDFLNKNLFGSHTDAANKKTNSGMLSWQGPRSKSLTQYLQGQGVLDAKGNIEQTQESLNAQAKFFIQEIMTEKRYNSSKNALLGDSSSYRDLEKVFGKNAIAWDYNGKNIGSDKAAKNLTRQDNYYNSLNKILGGDPENALSSIKDIAKYDDEAYKARKDLLDRIDQLQSQYDTEAVTRSKARDEEILQATILGQADLIPKIKDRYDAQDKLAKLQQEFDVEGHKWTEERKLQHTYDTNVLRLTAEGKFSDDQKKIVEKGLKDQLDQEKALIELAKEERIFQAEQAMMTEIQRFQKRYQLERDEIIKTTSDLEERTRKLNALNENTIRDGIGKNFSDPNDDSSQFLKSVSYGIAPQTNTEKLDEENAKVLQKLTDNLNAVKNAENASYEERLEAKRVFDEAKQQLDDEYYFKARDARQLDHENQLQLYSQMLSQASGVWGDMTNMIGEYKDENSKTYKTMFAAQQAFAIASAIVSTELAASKALELGPILGVPASSLVRGLGYASVGLIAAQAIAGPDGQGYFNGGYTGSGGRKEVAGVVHGQEYVLNAQATKRVGVGTLDAINSGKSLGGGGGDVIAPITVHVSVQSNGESSVDTQGQSKQLGQTIGNAVRTVIRQEQRQGGLLSK